MINTKGEVEAFIRQFKPKLQIWGILFLNREKNTNALKSLGITPNIREQLIREIEATDYIETIHDALSFGDLWVFGKDFDNVELYIKISIGNPNNKTICISFHEAEFPLRYAFKQHK